jgi:hypothetical protein
MKKLIVFAACAMLAAVTQAAAVGWSLAGATSYAGDAYKFFVIGQNGATSIATITALLDAGTDTSSYALGSGTIAANGSASVPATTAGAPTLGEGTYTGFFVVFDSATPASGSANYAVVSGASTLTKTIGSSTATVAFASGNASSILNNSSNWKSFGPTSGGGGGDGPEPTSGLLLLVGAGILGLRRKRA